MKPQKHFSLIILLSIGLTTFLTGACDHNPSQIGTNYYVNASNGDDTNTGTSPAQAWATLNKVNQQVFKPGEHILFKAGTVYNGQLKPRGSGSEGAPIIINKYGNGPKPQINGEGKYDATLWLFNVEYWEVNNLDITNTGPERKPRRRGVTVQVNNFGEAHHIYLDSLEVHHVNGSLVKGKGGGSAILWRNGGDSLKSRFIDLRIEHCYIHHTERNGINSSGYSRRDNWYPSLKVIVRDNLLEQVPGDGIVPIGTDGALIENNVMRDSPEILPEGEAAAGIWPWSSDNTVIQFNEVSGHNAPWDAQGFDSDWNCKNTLIQYNYSHDNAGGFLLICNNGNSIGTNGNVGTINTVVRYNISVNDGLRSHPTPRNGYFSPTFHISGPVSDTKIYNNVIYVPAKTKNEIDHTLVQMDNWGGPWPDNTLFANNIFYVRDEADFQWGKSKSTGFTHNLFYGNFQNQPNDPTSITKDPMFVDPGMAASGFESLTGFQLKANSPAIDAGTLIDGQQQVETDFFGNKLPDNGKVSIGVDEVSE